ncbi:unnamed protein product [Arabidopsis lyrata]|nr:unnamed protein product [Arabidopsis lyrata]
MSTSLLSNVNEGPQVFINFRGEELRRPFVSHLHEALRNVGINAFIDSDEDPGEDLENLFKRIEESEIALAILSSKYTESQWCLDELVKIMECSSKGEGCKKLWVIPIFYKLDTSIVKGLDGDFGVNLWKLWTKPGGVRDDRIVKWNAALQDARNKTALILKESSEEMAFLAKIVITVQNALTRNSPQSQEDTRSPPPSQGGGRGEEIPKFHSRALSRTESGEQRLKQLEEKLDVDCNDNETRIVAVVGMPGIGKTYLAKKLLAKLETKIVRHVFIQFDSERSKYQGLEWVQKTIVEDLLKKDYPTSGSEGGNVLENWKEQLREKKIVVVFDNVTDQKQIEPLKNCDWIKKGSRIVITTRDKSLTETLPCDLYEVPGLNDKDSLEFFRSQICSNLEGNFMELSRKIVDFAGGNPLALEAFGKELKKKSEDCWEKRLGTLTRVSSEEMREVLRNIFEKDLDEKQREAFLDIVCFFRSHDESYVTSLLDSVDPKSAEAGREEVRDLVDKFLIHISNGRVEIHDILFTMGKELVETTNKYWMLSSNSAVSADALRKKRGRDQVRGIVIDMSKMEEMPLDNQTFVGMSSLRYLKVYNSLCPRHCEARCKLNLPDELEFPKNNIIRYLDWMNFPGKELPSEFEPKDLIDLRLPYSKIISLWNRVKDTPKLKWVDLSHSSKLSSLSELSEAPNLLRLNLEGCTSLKELPEAMQKMKNLVFLNLRGCTSLLSLPKITMDSLKTLILSDCSQFQTFEVISEHLETLYLNGTAINGLPSAIGNLDRLILLNLIDCKNLVTLPDCLGKLKSLQELKLSRCSKLKIFPDVTAKMESLRVLLLDGTSIAEMPGSIYDLSLLRRLCLSRNDDIHTLRFDMGQMFHLKWLELKYCKNLISLPILPPNLQCLNAHGCTSLRTVASPQTLPTPTEQIHSTFIFTNCYELEQVSKNAIISYVQKKSKLMSADRYNQDFVFKSLIGTCFPGYDIPAWFNHQALGSVLTLKLPQHWNAGRLIGIALCVVVSFNGYKDQSNSLQVKCTCEFTNVSLSPESFIVGGFSEPGDETHTFEADHIFICYTTLLNIKKHQQFPSATEVSLGFQVTNGTSEVAKCKVMKCGFSLVYEPDEVENSSWKVTPRIEDKRQGRRSSFRTAEEDDDCPIATPTTATYNSFNRIVSYFKKV